MAVKELGYNNEFDFIFGQFIDTNAHNAVLDKIYYCFNFEQFVSMNKYDELNIFLSRIEEKINEIKVKIKIENEHKKLDEKFNAFKKYARYFIPREIEKYESLLLRETSLKRVNDVKALNNLKLLYEKCESEYEKVFNLYKINLKKQTDLLSNISRKIEEEGIKQFKDAIELEIEELIKIEGKICELLGFDFTDIQIIKDSFLLNEMQNKEYELQRLKLKLYIENNFGAIGYSADEHKLIIQNLEDFRADVKKRYELLQNDISQKKKLLYFCEALKKTFENLGMTIEFKKEYNAEKNNYTIIVQSPSRIKYGRRVNLRINMAENKIYGDFFGYDDNEFDEQDGKICYGLGDVEEFQKSLKEKYDVDIEFSKGYHAPPEKPEEHIARHYSEMKTNFKEKK